MKRMINLPIKSLVASLLMTCAMLWPSSMMADDMKWYLIAHDADGYATAFAMDDVGSLVAIDDAYDFTVLDTSGNVLAERILKVTFRHGEEGEDAVKSIKQPVDVISKQVKDKLTIIGVKGLVTIYDVAGKKCSQVEAQGGETIVNVSNLSAGIYVVKTGKQTFKFIKK